MTSTQIAVSVIIPVYNVELYLRECLDSVVNQTLKNIEIICVNDGSTDYSAEILNEYAEKDARIRIILQENQGLSAARNTGLNQAAGKYVYMLDSDDYLELDALEKLLCICENKKLECLFFDAVRFYNNSSTIPPQIERKEYSDIYSGIDFLKNTRNDKAYITSACMLIIRREFLISNNIKFLKGIIHEDELFCFLVLMEAKRVSHTKQKLYHRRLHQNSITTAKVSHKNVMGYFIVMQEMIKYGLSAEFDEIKVAEIQRSIQGMKHACISRYSQLSPAEREKIKFDNQISQTLFNMIIPTMQNTETDNQETNNSKYPGCLTWIPRKISSIIHYYQNNGFLRTVVRVLDRIHMRWLINMVKKSINKFRNIIKFYNENGLRATVHKILVRLGLKHELKLHNKVGNNLYYESLPIQKYEEEMILWYKHRTGQTLNLKKPKTFNEKLQWLKLYDNTPLKTQLADKYLVRDWIAEQIGEEYLVPLLGVWDNFDEINFDALPNKFVLKANHGSGWNIIVKDKSKFDKDDAKEKFDRWMKINYAFYGFEMHYMDIPPKIIAEQYLENTHGLIDYRFYCFNGEPKQVWIDIFSGTPQHLRSVFDMDWNPIPLKCSWPDGGELLNKKPKNFDKMKEFAALLSKDFSFVRVDFFEVNDQLYMGEMTFTPMNGTGKFKPESWDRKLGDMLRLPPKSPIPQKRS